MILGLTFETFKNVHVAISLIGIVSGVMALAGMLRSEKPGAITHLFLATTVLTSVTGFFFPTAGLTPAQIVGVISLAILAAALAALYVFHLAGPWRWIYAATAIAALYLNCFVLIVQGFQKLEFLAELAPNQNEPPFQIAQGALLVVFLLLGYRAVKHYRPYG